MERAAAGGGAWCLARELLIMDNGAEEGGDEPNTQYSVARDIYLS